MCFIWVWRAFNEFPHRKWTCWTNFIFCVCIKLFFFPRPPPIEKSWFSSGIRQHFQLGFGNRVELSPPLSSFVLLLPCFDERYLFFVLRMGREAKKNRKAFITLFKPGPRHHYTHVCFVDFISQARRSSFRQIMWSRIWIAIKVERIFVRPTTAWDRRLRAKLHYMSYVSKYLMLYSQFYIGNDTRHPLLPALDISIFQHCETRRKHQM